MGNTRVYRTDLLEADRSAFQGMVEECLEDRRIAGYFRRGLVKSDNVIRAVTYNDAFDQAVARPSWQSYAAKNLGQRDRIIDNKTIIKSGAMNRRTLAVLLSIFFIVLALFGSFVQGYFATLGTILAATLLGGISSWLLGKAQTERRHLLRRLAVSVLLLLASLSAIVLPHFLAGWPWRPSEFFVVWIVALALGYLLHSNKTRDECGRLLSFARQWLSIMIAHYDLPHDQRSWLEDCVEEIIIPQAVLAINTTLGKDKDLLLVEQNSEGLRRLQDPSFTVPTSSEQRILNLFSQMDGGSIALAGPRGAGKSTLLRKFAGPLTSETFKAPCVAVYLTAPAEYIPRDFIAGLLRELCEAYLQYVNCPLPEPIYKERSKFSFSRVANRMLAIFWLLLRAAIAILIVAWLAWPFIKAHYTHVYSSGLIDFNHFHNYAYQAIQGLWNRARVPCQIALLLGALIILPGPKRWKRRIRRRKEPALAKTAREHLLRLQIDKTVTWSGGVNSSAMRGIGLSLNRGGSASYTPWTLPELVRHTRRFMEDVSATFKRSNQSVIVGIDEIDRIGSLDHAERFIGEIKAVFGVEKCHFLVAVAEDVGSVFAQRTTAGRSILENAFDDIIVVEPLSLEEARDLLLKRVPGFTDSFVYLVHALSGGLPRELIRVTRRVVEVNQKLRSADHHPRLEDLTVALVTENLLETIRAARNQMSRLTLRTDWVIIFEKLRSSSARLHQSGSLWISILRSPSVVEELTELRIPNPPEEEADNHTVVTEDEAKADEIITNLSTVALFGTAVIEAFSGRFFDLEFMQHSTADGLEGSYEQLAAARAELSISSASGRAMLYQFRDTLRLRKLS
jgi:Cdc6-like AAA superfamily ATPase